MARLVYAAKALRDLSRIFAFVEDSEPGNFERVWEILTDGLSILERHPMAGGAFGKRLRKLVISRGKTGYVAVYAYNPETDVVLIVDVRHQRESGE